MCLPLALPRLQMLAVTPRTVYHPLCITGGSLLELAFPRIRVCANGTCSFCLWTFSKAFT